MKFLKEKKHYILKLELGEEIIDSVAVFCKKENITSGYFFGIGAVSKIKLSSYKLESKEYISQIFNEPLEIASLSGNIATLDKEIKLHCHGVFGKRDFTSVAGHLDEAIVSVTAEIIITPLDQELTRKFDSNIGLNLLDI